MRPMCPAYTPYVPANAPCQCALPMSLPMSLLLARQQVQVDFRGILEVDS